MRFLLTAYIFLLCTEKYILLFADREVLCNFLCVFFYAVPIHRTN